MSHLPWGALGHSYLQSEAISRPVGGSPDLPLASLCTTLTILFFIFLAEWSVLYVIIACFVIVVAFGTLSWTVICCCKR